MSIFLSLSNPTITRTSSSTLLFLPQCRRKSPNFSSLSEFYLHICASLDVQRKKLSAKKLHTCSLIDPSLRRWCTLACLQAVTVRNHLEVRTLAPFGSSRVSVLLRSCRLAKREQLDAERLVDLEASRDEQQQPDADCDDDQQLISLDGRRSPRRWFLPSPQGGSTLNRFRN